MCVEAAQKSDCLGLGGVEYMFRDFPGVQWLTLHTHNAGSLGFNPWSEN